MHSEFIQTDYTTIFFSEYVVVPKISHGIPERHNLFEVLLEKENRK